MTSQNPIRKVTVWPLADLFQALGREGFQLRPDEYVLTDQVIRAFQPETHADLRALIAPLIVTSEEEQEKFDRIFETVQLSKKLEPHSLIQELSIEPKESKKSPKPVSRVLIAGVLFTFLLFVYLGFLLPAPKFDPNIKRANDTVQPFQVGDTLRFAVDSTLRQASGSRARWQWEMAEGLVYGQPNVPEIEVVAREAGMLPVKLRSESARGWLFPTWTDSLTSVETQICARLPSVRIDSVRLPGTTVRYQFTAQISPNDQPIQLRQWLVNGQVMATNVDQWYYDFKASADADPHNVRLVVIPDTLQKTCVSEAELTIGAGLIIAPSFSIGTRSTGTFIVPKSQIKNPYRSLLWIIGIGALLLFAYYIWLIVRALRKKNKAVVPSVPENPLVRFVNDTPPLEIPFENRDLDFIVRDQQFYQVVRTLRQPKEGEARRLHINKTLRATIKEGGFPSLVFQPQMVESEYLFLIDQSQMRSQQLALFEYLFRVFMQENVSVERFFFHKTFDRFQNENHAKGITIQQLVNTYRNHTLLIWTNGKPLLYPPYPVVEPAVRQALAGWESRAILTPVPFADWGAKEKALQEDFLLLPADLIGQIRLIQALAEKDNVQDIYLDNHGDKLYSSEDYNFREVRELREYLGEDLFQWLAAVAVYPRIRWEVVIEMGRVILPPDQVNFTNLLKLVRINWMHDAAMPDTTRLALLKELTPENEAKARQIILRMLSFSEQFFKGEHFYDAEKYVLNSVNQFALYAHDPIKYQQYEASRQTFKVLYDNGLYHDGVTTRYLENPAGNWTTLLPAGATPDSSNASPPGISLPEYFASQSEPEKTDVDKERPYVLAGLVVLVAAFLGLFNFAQKPGNQLIDPDQQISLTIALDSGFCVTPGNTNGSSGQRWTVSLNDSVLDFNNLHATRTFLIKSLTTDSSGIGNDSVILAANLSVRDSATGEAAQYSMIKFSRDTIWLGIQCETPPVVPMTYRVSYSYANAERANLIKMNGFMTDLEKGEKFRITGRPDKPVNSNGPSQLSYYYQEDKPVAEALLAQAQQALGIPDMTLKYLGKRPCPPDCSEGTGRGPAPDLQMFINYNDVSNKFVCTAINKNWISQFDNWQYIRRDGSQGRISTVNNAIEIERESAPTKPVVDPKTGAQTVLGTALSRDRLGNVISICQQNGIYLVQLDGKTKWLVIGSVTGSSINLATVNLDTKLLGGPQGNAYFGKVLKDAAFQRYLRSTATKTPPKETGKPAADEKPASTQGETPAQAAIDSTPKVTNRLPVEELACKDISSTWINQLNNWQAVDKEYRYSIQASYGTVRIVAEALNAKDTRSKKESKSSAVTSSGSTQLTGSVTNICQQGEYIIVELADQNSKGGSGSTRKLVVSNFSSQSCRIAVMAIDKKSTVGSTGRAYDEGSLQKGSFRNYRNPDAKTAN